MNWEAIGAIGEVGGAVAVIATVIYLARQIRQNTSALRSTATQAAHDQAAKTKVFVKAGDETCNPLGVRKQS